MMKEEIKWSYLRKNSPSEKIMISNRCFVEDIVTFPDVERVMGKQWLEDYKKDSFFPFTMQRMSDLDKSIKVLSEYAGFSQWEKNVLSNIKQFHNYEFEIIELARIAKRMDDIVLQPYTNITLKDSPMAEMKAKKDGDFFMIEMTQLESMKNCSSKIEKLIKKARRQIGTENQGILFVDVSEITLKEVINLKTQNSLVLSDSNKINEISLVIKSHFKGKNTRLLGVVLVEYELAINLEDRVYLRNRYIYVHNPYNKLNMGVEKVQQIFLGM